MHAIKDSDSVVIRGVVSIFSLALLLTLGSCSLLPVGPTATISLSVTQGTVPLEVKLSAEGSSSADGEIVSCSWDLGDGNVSADMKLTHTYEALGQYVVRLSVENSKGRHASTTAIVHVVAPVSTVPSIAAEDLIFRRDAQCELIRVARVVRLGGSTMKIRLMRNGHEIEDISYSCSIHDAVKLRPKQVQDLSQIPEEYYGQHRPSLLGGTLQQLRNFLLSFKLPRDIMRTKYEDTLCAAYAEQQLENAGFDARIVLGPAPWPRASGQHAWVLVSLANRYVAIELTEPMFRPESIPGIIEDSDDSLSPYYSCSANRIYYGIYEAVASEGLEKFCWWKTTVDQW